MLTTTLKIIEKRYQKKLIDLIVSNDDVELNRIQRLNYLNQYGCNTQPISQ